MSGTDSELDRIINEGKVNPSTAMIIFAVELKSQGEKLDQLKVSLDSDSKRYVPVKEHDELKIRVSRLENALLGILVFVFLAVVGALLTLVIKK